MEYGLYKRLCVLAGMVALCASCSVRRSASDHSHYRDQERQVLESLDTSMDVRLAVPTPCEIGGETSGSYEGNSTLSGSRTKTVDTRSRRKRHSKARNMRTSEKKKRKAKRKRRTRAFSPGRKPAMRKSDPEIPNSTPISARTPSGGGRSA